MPITLPGSPSCVISLTCLGRPKGVRVRSGLRGVCAWEGVIPSLVVGGRVDARGVLASPGGRAVAGDALASPGGRANARGRVVLAWEGRAEARGALASQGGRAVARDALASLGGRAVA